MSEGPIPGYVDVRKAFGQALSLAGSVGLEALPRFKDCLASDDASIGVQLNFTVDPVTSQRQITGTLDAQVEMTCQRCLQPVAVALNDSIQLALLVSEDQVGGLEPEWDPWICAELKLELAELVEEQLMLALPIVILHADEACIEKLEYQAETPSDSAESEQGEKDNPFAVLSALKVKKESD